MELHLFEPTHLHVRNASRLSPPLSLACAIAPARNCCITTPSCVEASPWLRGGACHMPLFGPTNRIVFL